LHEYKTLTLALSQLSWKAKCPDTLYLDKKELAQVCGVNADADHLSQNLFRLIKDMPRHSFIEFKDKDKGMYMSGNFVRTIAMFKNVVRVRLEEEYLNLFGNLEKNYITMWSADIFKMQSERAVLFYELLRNYTDTRLEVNEGTVGIQKFKELFNIPKEGKGSYMTKDGHFARTHFERKVINPVCEELAKTDMITLLVNEDGSYYEKVKRGNKILGYKFRWLVAMRPRVANATETKEIQDRIDKNGQVLKVAKDIVKSKKTNKSKPRNAFHEFEQGEDIDYDALFSNVAKPLSPKGV
jgi:plasmid replication initiation protein